MGGYSSWSEKKKFTSPNKISCDFGAYFEKLNRQNFVVHISWGTFKDNEKLSKQSNIIASLHFKKQELKVTNTAY